MRRWWGRGGSSCGGTFQAPAARSSSCRRRRQLCRQRRRPAPAAATTVTSASSSSCGSGARRAGQRGGRTPRRRNSSTAVLLRRCLPSKRGSGVAVALFRSCAAEAIATAGSVKLCRRRSCSCSPLPLRLPPQIILHRRHLDAARGDGGGVRAARCDCRYAKRQQRRDDARHGLVPACAPVAEPPVTARAPRVHVAVRDRGQSDAVARAARDGHDASPTQCSLPR